MKTAILLFVFFMSQNLLAWGNRGHHSICTAATHLVKTDDLSLFLKFRMHTLGHLCTIPDIHWKSLGSQASDLGNPTHYIDPEIIGMKVSEVPTDLKLIIEKYTHTENQYKGKNKIFSIPKEMGTLWWRADQFFRLIVGLKTDLANTLVPKNAKEEQDEKLPYNQTIYSMLLYMGFLGHYVGDASQPFHTTADFDGYGVGHGGIHSYYEEQIIAHFGPDLEKQIVDKAKLINDKKLATGSPLEIMRHLSTLSNQDIDSVLKLDTVTKKSESKSEKGLEIKTPAVRRTSAAGYAKMKDLAVLHMARSAIVLSSLWDNAYHDAGSPSLQYYRSFRYPHTPEFIAPDYLGKTESKR